MKRLTLPKSMDGRQSSQSGIGRSNEVTAPASQQLAAAELPAPTPNLTQSLSQQELDDHRAKIGIEVEVVLDGYWHNRPDQAVKALILADWMDELEDWTLDQIRFGLRKWRDLNASKKPNPAHISLLLKHERGLAYVAQREGKPARALFEIGA